MNLLERALVAFVLSVAVGCTVVSGTRPDASTGGQRGALVDASTGENATVTTSSGGRGSAGGSAAVGTSGGSEATAPDAGDSEPSDASSAAPDRSEPECELDSDCDDGLGCNGAELCRTGRCSAGVAVQCAVPDATHCGAGCVEGVGCVVYPLDDDGDGFDSAACPGAAGDDCDDSRDDVHPAAPEVCDGVDNDCDGVRGVQAGLDTSGRVEPIADWDDAVIAWSEVADHFVIVGSHSKTVPEDAVFVGAITRSGVVTRSSDPWVDTTDQSAGHVVAVAVLDDGSRVVDASYSDRAADFARIFDVDASAGNPLADMSLSSRHDMASHGSDLILVRASGVEVGVHVVPDDGVTQPATLAVTSALFTRIATHGDDSAIVWERDGAIYASRISTDVSPAPEAGIRARLVASEPETLVDEGTSPDIESLPGGYAVAWRDPHGFRLSVLDVDGSRRCGPVAHIFGDVTPDTDRSLAVAYGAFGVFVVVTDTSSGEVGVYRFDELCRLVDSASIGAGAVAPLLPAVSVGGGRLGVLWSEGVDKPTRELRVRVMSDVLCE